MPTASPARYTPALRPVLADRAVRIGARIGARIESMALATGQLKTPYNPLFGHDNLREPSGVATLLSSSKPSITLCIITGNRANLQSVN